MKTTNSTNDQIKEARAIIVEGSKQLKEYTLQFASDVTVADNVQKTFCRWLMLANGIGAEKDMIQATALSKQLDAILLKVMSKAQFKIAEQIIVSTLMKLAPFVKREESTQKDTGKGPKNAQEGTKGKKQENSQAQAESEASKKERAERQAADKARKEAQAQQAKIAWDSLRNVNLKDYTAIRLEDVLPEDVISNDDTSQCYSIYDKGSKGIQVISFVSGSTVHYYSMLLEQFELRADGYYHFTATDGTPFQFKFYRKTA